MLSPPDADRLANVNDVSPEEFPEFALVEHRRDQPRVEDIDSAVEEALSDIDRLQDLDTGAEVAVTAGSRGIHDITTVLESVVDRLQQRDLEPFIIPAMGSHGGATAEGQREMLASLGITSDSMGCEIRSSMDVTTVSEDEAGRPIVAADDALAADAILLANRVKLHTDFRGDIESGLSKMAVIGLGKQRGAEFAHNAALDRSFKEVIPERANVLFEETPIIGGIALLENASERIAALEGVDVSEIPQQEPPLLARSEELLPTLPMDDLDLLVIDGIGKNISGTGMDTNVVGRMQYLGEPEFETPSYRRIHVRSLSQESHGNAIGMGLADFIHEDAVADLSLTDTYINAVTGGEPSRVALPLVAPTDAIAFKLAYSTTGVSDPSEMRIARIPNTLELGRYLVSEPLIDELADHPEVTILAEGSAPFDGENLQSRPYEP